MQANAMDSCVQKSPLPDERSSLTHQFQVGEFNGLLCIGFYKDGKIGEISIRSDKEGTSLNGLLRALSISISMGLQYGIPITEYLNKFKFMGFIPDGSSSDPNIRFASSILDYISKWIERKCLNIPIMSVVE